MAHAGDDGFFRRTADELREVGPHGHTGLHAHFNAILGDRRETAGRAAMRIGTINHARTNAGVHRFERVATREIDGGRLIEIEFDTGALRGDQRADHVHHIAAGQVVRFQPGRGDAPLADIEPRLIGHDFRLHDDARRHLAKAHPHRTEMLTWRADIYA